VGCGNGEVTEAIKGNSNNADFSNHTGSGTTRSRNSLCLRFARKRDIDLVVSSLVSTGEKVPGSNRDFVVPIFEALGIIMSDKWFRGLHSTQ
jgi:hypothetical protein